VSRRGGRQEMRGFEGELFVDLLGSQSGSGAAARRRKP
jgi:hypothetical protein